MATSIDEFGWLVGHWQGHVEDDPVELAWSSPGGGAICGFFRWVHAGKVSVYEFIELGPDRTGAISMRLKHFTAGLIAWEDKDAFITFKLTGATEREATFLMENTDGFRQLTYRRPDDDTLIAEMITDPAGENKMVFAYKRVE